MISSTIDPSTRDAVLEEIGHETRHFSAAPTVFLQAWKRAVSLAGVRFFGAGPCANPQQASSVWDLCPKLDLIQQSIGVLSSGEKVFLAALVSFYNAEDGGQLLRRVGFSGLADLGGLDLQRRSVIASLLLNYTGW